MGQEVSKGSEGGTSDEQDQGVASQKAKVLPHKETERRNDDQNRPTASSSHEQRRRFQSPPHTRSDRSPRNERRGFPQQGDHYSPPRRSISPPILLRDTASAAYSDRRDRSNRTHETTLRRRSSPVPPERAHFPRSPRSPVQRRASPQGRSSPIRRTYSGAGPHNSFDQSHSPSARGSTGYPVQNLVWKAPGYRASSSRPSLDLGNETVTSPEYSERIEFNGLIGVPTGPKSGLPRLVDELAMSTTSLDLSNEPVNSPERSKRIEYNGLVGVPTGPKSGLGRQVDELARPSPPAFASTATNARSTMTFADDRPHISISASDLRTMPTIRKHLARFLKVGEQSIYCDSGYGWRIVFDDSSKGRAQLQKCYGDFHLKLLFSQHVLNMQCFPNGNDLGLSFDNATEKPTTPSSSNPQLQPPLGNGESIGTGTAGHPAHSSTSHPAALQVPSAATRDTMPIARPDDVNTSMSIRATGSPLSRSSPVAMRTDKDDSSSISALTASDTSGAKAQRCHVCRAPSVSSLEPLINCTTCPRKYHRRCPQPKDSVPHDADGLRTWQCQRCLKKQIPPGSRLSMGSFPPSSPTIVASRRNPPEDATADEDQGAQEATAPGKLGEKGVPSTAEGRQFSVPAKVNATRLSDADDLVERSFTDAKLTKQHTNKTGRLQFVPKKVAPVSTARSDLATQTQQDSDQDDAVLEESRGEKRRMDEDQEAAAPRKRTAHDRALSESDRANVSEDDQPLETLTAAMPPDATIDSNQAAREEPNFTTVKPKFKPIPPHLRAKLPKDPSEPKRKPHKWSGTGADRNIIESGLGGLFNHSTPQSGTHLHDDALGDECTEKDVQDKPLEELRATFSTAENSNTSRASSLQADSATGPSRGQASRKAAGAAVKRQKLVSAATRQCQKCQKTIALTPSGNNIYCMKCKREMKDPSTPQGHVQAEASPVLSAQGSFEKAATASSMNAVAHQELPKGVVLEDALGPNLTETIADQAKDEKDKSESAVATDPLALSSAGKPKRVDQRTSCEACRISHKRCTHRVDAQVSDSTNRTPTPDENDIYSVQQTPNKRRLDPSEEDEAEGNRDDATDFSEPEGDTEAVSADEDEASTSMRKKVIKRRSFRSVAKNEYDLGNGYSRPLGSYVKLIGMALCSVAGNRMKTKDIVSWIVDNVPGYDRNMTKGHKWENGIAATVSIHRYRAPGEKQKPDPQYWYSERIDPNNKSKGCIVELMAGVKETMLHWDGVLKQPVSPVKLNRSTPVSKVRENTGGDKRSRKRPRKSQSTTQHDQLGAGTTLRDPDSTIPGAEQNNHSTTAASLEDVNVITEDIQQSTESLLDDQQFAPVPEDMDQSSDDEPLFQRKRTQREEDEPIMSARKRLMAAFKGEAVPVEGHTEPATPQTPDTTMKDAARPIEAGASEAIPVHKHDSSPAQYPRAAKFHTSAKPAVANNVSLAARIKCESQNVDYSALSLFEEWPEYDPSKKPFNKAAKLAEIKARPRRKQRFRMPLARDPWAEPRPTHIGTSDGFRQSSASLDRLTRTPNKTQRTFDPWQFDNGETDKVVCETWEEFFELPTNPIPVLQDGQLAYRDGTQNDDGMLRRAKVIFKTGYA